MLIERVRATPLAGPSASWRDTMARDVAQTVRIPVGRGRGGLVHARGPAAGRLPARVVAPGAGAGAQRRPAAARTRGDRRPSDADGAGVRAARRVGPAARRAGAPLAAAGGRGAADRDAVLDRDRHAPAGDPRLAHAAPRRPRRGA